MKKLSVLLTFLVAVSFGFMYEVSADCNSDSDCADPEPFCDNGICHECEADFHCAYPQSFCCDGTCQAKTCRGCSVKFDEEYGGPVEYSYSWRMCSEENAPCTLHNGDEGFCTSNAWGFRTGHCDCVAKKVNSTTP